MSADTHICNIKNKIYKIVAVTKIQKQKFHAQTLLKQLEPTNTEKNTVRQQKIRNVNAANEKE